MAFPDEVVTFTKAIDPSSQTDMQNIAKYQNYLLNGNFSDAQALLATITNGIEMNLNAGRFNEVLNVIEEIEQFYYGLNGVKQYINDNINAFSDIKEWNKEINYKVGNIASDGNQWFICKKENSNIQPKVSTNWKEYWDYFIKNQKQYPITKANSVGLPIDDVGEIIEQEIGDIWFELVDNE
jgi:hypothetical protein